MLLLSLLAATSVATAQPDRLDQVARCGIYLAATQPDMDASDLLELASAKLSEPDKGIVAIRALELVTVMGKLDEDGQAAAWFQVQTSWRRHCVAAGVLSGGGQ